MPLQLFPLPYPRIRGLDQDYPFRFALVLTLPPHTWARQPRPASAARHVHLTPAYVGSTTATAGCLDTLSPYPRIRGLDTNILWLLRGRTTPVVPFAIMIMALGRRLALKESTTPLWRSYSPT